MTVKAKTLAMSGVKSVLDETPVLDLHFQLMCLALISHLSGNPDARWFDGEHRPERLRCFAHESGAQARQSSVAGREHDGADRVGSRWSQ